MAAKSRQDLLQDLSHDPAALAASLRDPETGARRLKGISLFARFSDEELKALYAIGKLVILKPKSNAVVEGEPTRGMYILLHGRVSVYKTDPTTGSMVRLAILEEGANFGEISLFDTAPRSATVAAETMCYLFQLDAEDFNAFLDKTGPELQVRFFKTCAEELAVRFRTLNGDYLNSQRLLWKYALRRGGDDKTGKGKS
jgi:CRP-like cAMP-binding protein